MKKLVALFLAVAAYVPLSQAQYFTDMFTGTSLNSSYWQATIPYSDSTAYVTSGALLISNAGRVITVPTLPSSVDVTIKFAFTGSSYNNFKITTRNNGALSSVFFSSGVLFQISERNDNGSTSNNISVSTSSGTVGVTTYPINLNQTYSARVVDDGTYVSFYINDMTTPLITGTTTIAGGHAIGLQCREGAAAGSSISAGSQVQISAFAVNESVTTTTTVTNTVDVPTPGTRFINMSTITTAGSLSTGFIITGTTPEDVLLRVGGPALKALSVPNPATQTSLVLYNQAGSIIATNSGWSTNAVALNNAFIAVGAFAFPAGSNDSALLVTLQPGSYTAAANGNGTIILEAYEAP